MTAEVSPGLAPSASRLPRRSPPPHRVERFGHGQLNYRLLPLFFTFLTGYSIWVVSCWTGFPIFLHFVSDGNFSIIDFCGFFSTFTSIYGSTYLISHVDDRIAPIEFQIFVFDLYFKDAESVDSGFLLDSVIFNLIFRQLVSLRGIRFAILISCLQL